MECHIGILILTIGQFFKLENKIVLEVRNKISNLELKQSAEELLSQLWPICEVLNKIWVIHAKAVDIWEGLCDNFDNALKKNKSVKEIVKKAATKSSWEPTFYQEKTLSKEEVNIAR